MESRDDELVALIARCAIRDQAALKELFDRLGGYLHAVAYRIVKADDLSNDVLQDAFVQIWTNAASYRPSLSKPLTWITSIVRYRALDKLDRERKHTERIVARDEELPLVEGEDSPERQAQGEQMRGLLLQCMQGLSQQIRYSIQLAYLEGYSREEIAGQLETNINTVKSWLFRGAERLRRCLEAKINNNV